MTIELDNLSPKELKALIAGAEEQLQHARAAQVQSVKGKIEKLLRDNGLSLSDVYPTRAKSSGTAAKRKVEPKYRNPRDPSQTWSGRGRQPAWFANALKGRGVTVDSLMIGRPTNSVAPTKKAGSRKATTSAIGRAGKKSSTRKKS